MLRLFLKKDPKKYPDYHVNIFLFIKMTEGCRQLDEGIKTILKENNYSTFANSSFTITQPLTSCQNYSKDVLTRDSFKLCQKDAL